MCNDLKFEKSSGNVFKDIGFSEAEAAVLLSRTKLTFEIFTLLKKSRLRRVKAAKLLAVEEQDILKLKNGDFDDFSIECLSHFRDRLKCYVEGQVPTSEKEEERRASAAP